MHSIQYVKADQWQVLDENHQGVFVGNKQQVEDWLDLQENLRRRSSPQMSLESLVQSLRQVIYRLTGRLFRHVDSRIGNSGVHSHATKR